MPLQVFEVCDGILSSTFGTRILTGIWMNHLTPCICVFSTVHIEVSLICLQPLSMLILLSIMTVIIIVTVHLIVVFTALQQINNICSGLFQSILTLLLHSCAEVSEDHAIFTFFGYH